MDGGQGIDELDLAHHSGHWLPSILRVSAVYPPSTLGLGNGIDSPRELRFLVMPGPAATMQAIDFQDERVARL
ncbi:hypothetical protein N7539_006219 [Penicillium diatomitis]|uniref:Uncharacterized protein n=1 Tax=Penicillium diatomitis TaxID=2819901 RepID=A0A9W9X303_9EURO|nr:uncharacterized protein N7539_006219 [Penicillium diatomitis]KAJ5482773.1 hypothetical protein N7539_006219 [Penicillium diatomitis]